MNPTLRNALPHKETPFFRVLHILVAVLVLVQIINSNFTESEALHESGLNGIVTWMHIISGSGLIFCGIAMMAWMLTQRGCKYYFAWLALDFRGIVDDIRTLSLRQLPDAHAGGMAATVQGLGVLALLGGALCGAAWFVLNATLGPVSSVTESALHLHKFLTVFIETYFWAHGFMGLVHMYLTLRAQRKYQCSE
ncbi:cytochrome b/b6 domain-containing protein [Enterobacter asburiae]|uniref:cytochrome b/b6 domain-containing protein n=1 Tax=Enterobacter asburiae TaxID=61645 RepID=UPI002FFB5391